MKATTVIVTLFVLHVNTSFIDDFTGAMTSVEESISKLLNDVATDVETTMHCTILAMEQVLVVSGAISEPSTYGYNCYGRTDSTNESQFKLPPDNFKSGADSSNYNRYLGTDISQQMSSSISKVNNSLIHMIDNGGHENLKHIKKNVTNRLIKVGLLLRHELDRISNGFSKKIQQHNDPDKLSLETVWDDMKILHNVERSDKNVSEIKEIGQVLNEAVNLLHVNNTSDIKSDDDKIAVIMRELEQDADNNLTYSSIDQELSQWKEKQSELLNYSNIKVIPEDIPKNFKDLKDKIFNVNRNEIVDYTNKPTSGIQEKMLSLEKSVTESKEIAGIGKQDEPVESHSANFAENDYYSLFGGISKEEHIKAIDQAKDIIKEQSRAKAMLDVLFAKGENSAHDDFNNPDNLDFGSYK